MSTEIITSIINAFAPTIASKLIPILTNRKMSQEEYNIAMLSLLAEQNNRDTKMLDVLNDNCIKIDEANESLSVLLRRTEAKKKKMCKS